MPVRTLFASPYAKKSLTGTPAPPATGLYPPFYPGPALPIALPVTGNEITDAVRTAHLSGDGRARFNFCPNGSFEVDLTFWDVLQGGEVITRVTTDSKYGTACMQVHVQGIGNEGPFNPTGWVIPPNTTITVSVWLKGTGQVFLQAIERSVANTNIVGHNSPVITMTSDVWTQYSVTFTSGPTCNSMRFNVQTQNTDPNAYTYLMDGVQVEIGSTFTAFIPTTNAPGIAGSDSTFGLWEPITNLITNGGFETNTTGWTTGGTNAIASSAAPAVPAFGAKVMKCTYQDNTLLADYAITTANFNTRYTVSAYVWIPLDYNGGQIRLIASNFAGAQPTLKQADADMTKRNQWQRLSFTILVLASDHVGNLQLIESGAAPTAGKFVFMDGVQWEQSNVLTPYVETNGATAARASARIGPGQSTGLTPAAAWMALRIRMGTRYPNGVSGFDQTGGFGTYMFWGSQGGDRAWVNGDGTGLSLDLVQGAHSDFASPQRPNPLVNLSAGDILTCVFWWDANFVYGTMDGINIAKSARSGGTPNLSPWGWYLLSDDSSPITSQEHADADVFWAALGNGAPDLAALYAIVDSPPSPDKLAGGVYVWTADTAFFQAQQVGAYPSHGSALTATVQAPKVLTGTVN